MAVQVGELALRMLAEDVDAARKPPPPILVLLPARDAYPSGHRDLIVPDPALRKRVWQPQVSPGVVVAGGEVIGTWRRRGTKRLTFTVETARPLVKAERNELDAQSQAMAELRGAAGVDLQLTEG